jgi:hypothetical protein
MTKKKESKEEIAEEPKKEITKKSKKEIFKISKEETAEKQKEEVFPRAEEKGIPAVFEKVQSEEVKATESLEEVSVSTEKIEEENLTERISGSIQEAAKVSVKAVVAGYNKAEAFVKSEEFKRGVETTKNTTKAVAAGIFRGFKRLGEEVSRSIKEAKSKGISDENPNKDRSDNI